MVRTRTSPEPVHRREQRQDECRKRAERAHTPATPLSSCTSIIVSRRVFTACRRMVRVTAMHEDVQQRAREQEQVWQRSEEVGAVLRE
jgi:hypothetical protein